MAALVGIIMGSKSDWEIMSNTSQTLESLGVTFEVRVLSAHRTPDQLFEYVESAEERGLVVIIAAAGGAPGGGSGGQNAVAGARRANGIKSTKGIGLASVDGSNAGGHTGGNTCNREGRRC